MSSPQAFPNSTRCAVCAAILPFMGFFDWIKRALRRAPSPSDLVRYYDQGSRQVIRIPRSELAPGCMLVRIQGIDEPVWASSVQYQSGPLRHPPFSEEIREYVRRIQSTFAEHRPLSAEEWEDGFRRDTNVEQEIALWIHAGSIYAAFTESEQNPARRKHYYQAVVACLTASPDGVKHVLPPGPLSENEVEEVVRKFFPGKSTG